MQEPHTVVLSCSDSRVIPEYLFSAVPGELFVIRNVGNIADEPAMEAVRYGVEHLGASTVLVLGHRDCGAIKAALKKEPLDCLQAAIRKVKKAIGNERDPAKCEEKNVRSSMNAIMKIESIAFRIREGSVTVKGALYDPSDGSVCFLSN